MTTRTTNGTKAPLAGAIVALAAASIGLVVAFGVNLSVQQQQALLTFVTTAVVVVGVVHISRKVANVETMVNGNHEAQVKRIDQLQETITQAGGAVPPLPPKPDDA